MDGLVERTISVYENPFVEEIGDYAFYSCGSLTSVILPQVTTIGISAFGYCYSLASITLPQVTNIRTHAFSHCFNLLSLYLPGSTIPTLVSTAFFSTPISTYTTSTGGVYGSIYVPASLVASYKAASIWSFYSARITAI